MATGEEFAGANQKFGGRPQRFKLDDTSEYYYIGSEVIAVKLTNLFFTMCTNI